MKNKFILLIDDDKDDQLLFREAVNEIDKLILCDFALDGIEGISKLKAETLLPQLIFLDLNMPIMHGFECLEKIKSEPALQNVPVIIFTTSNSPADIEKARQLGAAAYFCKPMDYIQLCMKLKSILQLSFENTGIGKEFLGLI